MVSLGAPLDDWQDAVLEAAMGERADGKWASKFVGLSVARQNGKSQLIVARALAGVLLFGEKMIIISAHETDTARQVWKRMIDIIEENPTLEARVSGRMDAINREFISFGRGADRQEIRLKARGKSGVRGFSADCLLLDEGQILGKPQWGSIVPTMSARENPQMWLFGTPPTPEDDPFAFTRVREAAMGGKTRHCWLEWSADHDDDYDDPATWWKANPSPRVPMEAIEDDRAALDDGQFGLERLGIWPKELADAAITRPLWIGAQLEAAPPLTSTMALGLHVNLTRSKSAIVAAMYTESGDILIEHVPAESTSRGEPAMEMSGTSWLPPRVKELVDRWEPGAVVVHGTAAAASLITELEAQGLSVTVTSGQDMARAAAQTFDALTEGRLKHLGQEALTAAALTARWRERGESRVWDWKNEITAWIAATLAVHGLVGVTEKAKKIPQVHSWPAELLEEAQW